MTAKQHTTQDAIEAFKLSGHLEKVVLPYFQAILDSATTQDWGDEYGVSSEVIACACTRLANELYDISDRRNFRGANAENSSEYALACIIAAIYMQAMYNVLPYGEENKFADLVICNAVRIASDPATTNPRLLC
jgi:hypothetical protein